MTQQRPQRLVWIQRGALMVIALVVGWFGARAMKQGAFVDQCSEELVQRATARDKDYLRETVQSPLVAEQLLAASTVELVFVRPVSEELTRVGLALKMTSTSTRAELLHLVMDTRVTKCAFLRDYESGAFGTP